MKKFTTAIVLSFLFVSLTLLSLPGLASASDPLVGEIVQYAGDTPPDGWLLADGSAISRTLYADLFSVIGTDYGPGDGSTTFNIPDVEDRFPVGAVMPWPGYYGYVPDGWFIMNGQAISRTAYSELYSKVATQYGSGDGSTTFNLPNVERRFIVGSDEVCSGCNPIPWGTIGGQATITLTTNEMPDHNHGLRLNDAAGSVQGIGFDFTASGAYYTDIWIQSAGSGQPFDITNPYVAMNWIIRASGRPDFIIYTGVFSTTPTPTPTATPVSVYLPYIYTHTLDSGHQLVVPVEASFGQLLNGGLIATVITVVGLLLVVDFHRRRRDNGAD